MRLSDYQRSEDRALFEDLSWGKDGAGLWLWCEMRSSGPVIVVRPWDHRSREIVERELGGRCQTHHRYDFPDAGRDWLVPAARIDAVLAARPRLLALRAGVAARGPARPARRLK